MANIAFWKPCLRLILNYRRVPRCYIAIMEARMNKNIFLAALIFTCTAATPAIAQDELTGMFRMTHTTLEVVGEQMAQALNDTIPADQRLKWQLYVPDTYNAARPPGVFIFLDPNGYGGMPDQWRAVFENHNLIWVGPNTDNRRASETARLWHAILGLRAIEQEYAIDLNRVYIGSAGYTAATALNVQLNANEIKGAVYMRTSVMWKSLEPDSLEALQRKRHVFITGTNDDAKAQIRRDYGSYQDAGIHEVKLIFDTQHIGKMPDPDHMDEAIRFLDGG